METSKLPDKSTQNPHTETKSSSQSPILILQIQLWAQPVLKQFWLLGTHLGISDTQTQLSELNPSLQTSLGGRQEHFPGEAEAGGREFSLWALHFLKHRN